MIVLTVILGAIALDLLSKYLTLQLLVPAGGEVTVIPYILNFCYVENTGAAFGMLKNHRWIFMTLSVLLIIGLLFYLKCSGIKHKLFLISLSLIIGGGIGNMIDRVFVGYVVDFIKVTFIDFPVFNIADSAVVVGAVLLVVYFCFFEFNNRSTDKK